ncbi:MAG: Ig-like domain-containing protein, partial [Gemmatimonadota bacterium]|nr:Ig-like domain-containing protein [Gemmatimonadota bacterium]
SIVSGNRSTHNNASAGAITVFGRVVIANCAIVNNTATYYGAITIPNSELRMFNSTVSQNSATLVGGISQQAGTFHLTNSTITRNIATSSGFAVGGILLQPLGNFYPNFYPRNSIIASNLTTTLPTREIVGHVRSRGNNIFGISLGIDIRESSPTDLLDVDALLDFTLSTNGGVIPSHALATGSPAVDSGDNCVLLAIADGGCSDVAITHDHRGVVRPQDADSNGTATVDRGAFEVTPAEVAAAPGAPDLHSEDDSGISDTDNITSTSQVTFDIGNITPGATVDLFRNNVIVTSGVAAGTTITFEDTLSVAGSYVYTARQTSGGVTSLQGGALTVKFDNIAPSGAINQAMTQADPTRFQPINYTLIFSEPILGLELSDLTFAGSSAGVGSANVVINSDAAPTYHFAVSNITSDGAVVLGVINGAVQDAAGNVSGTILSGDNHVSFDTTAPTVTINQAATQADPTRPLPINFTVVFNEAVIGFAGADVSLAGSTANVTSASRTITGTGPTYNVAINSVTSNGGTVVASIPALAVQDAAGNTSLASTSTDNSVTLDNVAPTVTINQAAGQSDPTNTFPVNYTVIFSESVTDFNSLDVSLSNSTLNTSGASITVTGSGTTYNVAVANIPPTAGGNLRATVRSGAAIDALGNPSFASTSTDNSVFLDTVSPSVSVNQAIGQTDPTSTQPINFTAVFSELVTGLQPSDISLAGSTANVSSANVSVTGFGNVYTVSVSGVTSSGQVRVSIPAGSAQDGVGNGNLASTSTDNSVTVIVRAP